MSYLDMIYQDSLRMFGRLEKPYGVIIGLTITEL
jgi:hypothetical protein